MNRINPENGHEFKIELDDVAECIASCDLKESFLESPVETLEGRIARLLQVKFSEIGSVEDSILYLQSKLLELKKEIEPLIQNIIREYPNGYKE